MSRGEWVENSIWEELEPLSSEAALFYLWSFTNPRCNMSGLYKASERSMLESKVPVRKLGKVLEELERAQMVFYRPPWLWVKARVKRLHTTGPNMAKSIVKDVQELPADHPLRISFLHRYKGLRWFGDTLRDLALESGNGEGLPEPSIEGSNADADAVAKEEKATSEQQVDGPPEGLAPDLLERLPAVKTVLDRIVDVRGANARPTLLSVGRVLAAFPLRDHIGEAEKMEHWLVHGEGKAQANRDPVARYRRWLERAPEVVAPSRSAGSPQAMQGQNVMQLDPKCRRCGEPVEAGRGAWCEECSEAIAEGAA